MHACCADVAGEKEEPHKYVFEWQDEPFSFEVTRVGDPPGSAPVWNTTGHRLLFKEQYLEITSWVPPGSTLYGLGERISSAGSCPCHCRHMRMQPGLEAALCRAATAPRRAPPGAVEPRLHRLPGPQPVRLAPLPAGSAAR